MPFKPVNRDHSIVAVGFSVMFAEQLPVQLVEKIKASHVHLARVLPAVDSSPLQSVDVGPNGIAINSLPAVGFFFMLPNGMPAWEARAQENSLNVICRTYSRWQSVWGQARQILVRLLETAREDNLRVIEVILEYHDLFQHDGVDQYNLAQLLEARTVELAPKIFESGPTWHLYTGWFRTQGPDAKILEQVKFDSTPSTVKAGSTDVRILHTQRWRPNLPLPLPSLTAQRLDELMDSLHLENKNFLKRVLTPHVRQSIDLT